MDEQKQPPPDEEQEDVEAHGLKETVAAAAAVGAIAVPSASAFVPTVNPDGSTAKLTPASVQGGATAKKKTTTKKAAKKKAATKSSAGKTSPKKPVLQPEPTGESQHSTAGAGKTSPKKPPLMPEG